MIGFTLKDQQQVDSLSFPIPQFIVIGKQSVGKSRLIEASWLMFGLFSILHCPLSQAFFLLSTNIFAP